MEILNFITRFLQGGTQTFSAPIRDTAIEWNGEPMEWNGEAITWGA